MHYIKKPVEKYRIKHPLSKLHHFRHHRPALTFSHGVKHVHSGGDWWDEDEYEGHHEHGHGHGILGRTRGYGVGVGIKLPLLGIGVQFTKKVKKLH